MQAYIHHHKDIEPALLIVEFAWTSDVRALPSSRIGA